MNNIKIRLGVLHLGKSSPPKRNLFGGMEENKKGKWGKIMREKREPAVL